MHATRSQARRDKKVLSGPTSRLTAKRTLLVHDAGGYVAYINLISYVGDRR